MPALPTSNRRRRPPFFSPVPLRSRQDGWTMARQCDFLGHLYLTGSVSAAARAAGMSRMSAYRLRRRDDAVSFAHAWDVVLTPPGAGRVARDIDWRKVTDEELFRRVNVGLLAPLIHQRRVVGMRQEADNSALLRLLRRLDAAPRSAQEAEPGA
jgi:hypothetical protein